MDSESSVSFNSQSIDVLIVRIGGAIMVLSALLSWLEIDSDGFANDAGFGASTSGAGLVVAIAGLYLLLRPSSVGSNLGWALGGLLVVVIFVVRTESVDNPFEVMFPFDQEPPELGVGAWIGLGGAAVSLLGACWGISSQRDRHPQKMDVLPALVGSILAITSSFLLTWALVVKINRNFEEGESRDEEFIHGVNTDVITGIPIVVLGGLALVAAILLMAEVLGSAFAIQLITNFIRTAGIAIGMLAVTDVFQKAWGFQPGSLFLNYNQFVTLWSGPLVAAAGGIVLARSVRVVESDTESTTAPVSP